MELHTTAYAKLNLYLAVGARRVDGYHTLDSVMQTVSFGDPVTLSVETAAPGEQTILFHCDPPVCADGENLAYRAALAYFAAAACPAYRARLTVKKQIPCGAGFGGGSADAAAVLRLLTAAYGPLPGKTTAELARSLGADVPFCLLGGTALCRGIGDELTALAPFPACTAVLAFDGEGVNTAAAYRAVDALPPEQPPACAEMLRAIDAGDFRKAARGCYNRFEAAVLPKRPRAQALIDRLRACGAEVAAMSGSGAGVYGLFRDGGTAASAAEQLQRTGAFACSCMMQENPGDGINRAEMGKIR